MHPTTPQRFRLFYVDDSGSPASGIVVYSWLECDAATWRNGWQSWADLREKLHIEHAIPPHYQLHATHFAGAHGNPSTRPGWNRHKHLRNQVMRTVLAHLAATPGIALGTVYRRTDAKRDQYARHRNDVYQRFVLQLNDRLAGHHEHGMIFTDGDGSDPSYRDAHRALAAQHRRVLEDPQFPRSPENSWLQLADLVAWTAFQHLHRAPNRRVAWHWYDAYLASRDVHGGPIAL
jgi:hypothetical protein